MRSRSLLAFMALVLFSHSSCATFHITPVLNPELAWKKINDPESPIRTFQGNGQMIYESPGFSERGSISVTIQFPDSCLLQFKGPLGRVHASLFFWDDSVYFFQRRSNSYYVGPNSPDVLQELTGVYFTQTIPHYLLTGQARKSGIKTGAGTIIDSTGHSYTRTFQDRSTTFQYTFNNRGRFILSGVVTDREMGGLYEIEFDKITKIKKWYVPRLIKYTEPLARRRFTVLYHSQRINDDLDAGIFRMAIPDGAEQIQFP